jgi:hypothetical protein
LYLDSGGAVGRTIQFRRERGIGSMTRIVAMWTKDLRSTVGDLPARIAPRLAPRDSRGASLSHRLSEPGIA